MNPFHRLHALRMENDQAGFDMAAMRGRFDRMANRHENGTAPRAVVAYQLFQTPAALARRMVDLLGIQAGARVLEPSAGLGRLLDVIATKAPREVVAVESAPACAGELFAQNRPITIKQRDFLTITPTDIGLFDAIVMNPPFHMRSDIRHIQHARSFLAPGGSLVAICLDTHHRHAAFNDVAASWEPLGPETFRESGTSVPTILLTIKNKP